MLGFSDDLIAIQLDRDGPHAILVGPTGAGKTVLLRQAITSLLRFSSFELLLLDFKGGTGLAEFKAFATEFETDRDVTRAAVLLERAKAELQIRETTDGEHQPWILVIDELAHLLTCIPNAIDVLSAISARGRAFRMHLVLTNQNLVGVPRALLSNLRLRILVGDTDPVDAAMLGQSSRGATIEPLSGFAVGRIASHHAAVRPFYFALPQVKEPKPEQPRLDHAHLQRPGLATGRRASSGRARGRHRQHKQRASLGLQSRERKAGLR